MGKRKLYKADLIEMNERRKEGATLRELSKAYGVRKEIVKYHLRLMDLHGYAILRGKQQSKISKRDQRASGEGSAGRKAQHRTDRVEIWASQQKHAEQMDRQL